MKKILLLLSVLFIGYSSQARDIRLNAYADKLLDDAEYTEIIKKQCRQIAEDNGLARVHFESNFNTYRDSIILLSNPLIEKKFTEIENRISKQNIKDNIAVQLFEKALSNAISVTLSQNQGLKKALLTKNLNDRIIAFDSKINIDKTGTIDVTETITIANFNEESADVNNTIKRGITRDFPTRYSTSKGFMTSVPFTLLSVSRNGEKENYRKESIVNGYRIYCGRSDHFLEEGIHKYVIHYSTAKQIKFHDDRDEFYWNVTGNGWSFSIEKASCEIMFPDDAITSDLNCYTGFQGEKGQNCQSASFARNSAEFSTTELLEPYEGFTISVSVKKGVIQQNESSIGSWKAFALDNILIVVLFAIVLLLSLFLFRYWWRVGRDPAQGIIIPGFSPPDDLSPAAVGFVYHQKYNDKLLTAAIIDLAVQKKLRIEVDKEGLIFKTNVYRFLAPENTGSKGSGRDYDLYNKYGFDADDLFGIEIEKGKYNARFASVRNSFKSKMNDNILTDGIKNKKKGLLALNNQYIGIGFVLLVLCSIGTFAYCAVTQPPTPTIIYAVMILLIGFIIQFIFARIIKALTNEGRRVADLVLGFKMYLETAEKNVLDLMNPPEENIQLFEKYLPYAIALGVENRWSDKFKAIIERSLAEGYSPSYYSLGSHGSFSGSSHSFASAFSSGLSGSVSSASTPPSSSGSSGSGGGGSSGGGGGGGGGGGW